MVEHHIQKGILDRLSRAESLRFSELKSEGLEGNLFMYHLKYLINQGYVEKSDQTYRLSVKGLTYIDSYSFRTQKLRQQAKIITLIAVQNTQGKWLLAKRKYQPYINEYMLINGKQHFGESPEDHVVRELNEKLRMEIPVIKRGHADIRIRRDEQLITHVSAYIYEGYVDMNEAPEATSQLEFSWHEPNDPDIHVLPGTWELLARIREDKELFFFSLDGKDN